MYKFHQYLAIVLILSAPKAWAHQHNHYIEIDPGSFVFKGYSLNLFTGADKLPGYRFGIAVFNFEFPDFIIESNSKNRNKGWNLRTNLGFDLYIDRLFSITDTTEWFAGYIGVYFDNELSNDSVAAKASSYSQLSNGVRAGFLWFPFGKHLYINPWLAVTYNARISGSTNIENSDFNIQHVSPFATIHLGYRF